MLQGIGAAALTPNSLGLVLPLFPAEKRSTVIGAWAGIGAVGASIAPPLGGLLVEVSWRLIFIVNVPLGLIAIVLALRLAPEVRDARATRLPDVLGIAMLVAAVGLLTLGLTQGTHWGWDERVFGAFARRGGPRRGVPAPLRPPSRRPSSSSRSCACRPSRSPGSRRCCSRPASPGLLLGNVLFFTEVWDYSVLKAGFAFAPGPLLAATTAVVSGRLADGRQPAAFGAVGGFVFAAGCLWFITHAGADPAYLTDDPPGPGADRHRRRAAAAVLHRHRGGDAPRPSSSRPGSACRRCAARSARRSGSPSWVAIVGTPAPADAVDAFGLGLAVHGGHRGARRARAAADGSWAARPYTGGVTSDEIRETVSELLRGARPPAPAVGVR